MHKTIETYRVLFFLASACLITFFLWASFTEIDQQVRGSGKVVTYGKVRMIQHLEDGIVREILVKEGQEVSAGEDLFKIANTRAESEMKEISVTSSALLLKQIRLKAERDEKNTVAFPAKLSEKNDNIEQGQYRAVSI